MRAELVQGVTSLHKSQASMALLDLRGLQHCAGCHSVPQWLISPTPSPARRALLQPALHQAPQCSDEGRCRAQKKRHSVAAKASGQSGPTANKTTICFADKQVKVQTCCAGLLPKRDQHTALQIALESGEIGRLANGAVMATQGDTVSLCMHCAAVTLSAETLHRVQVVYATACTGEESLGNFLPLSVSYSERFSAAGRTRSATCFCTCSAPCGPS